MSVDAAAYMKERAAAVDAALDHFLPAESVRPERLHKAMRYSVFAGGKRLRPALFRDDVRLLFELLRKREIQPLIAARMPLAEARNAQALLSQGGVIGKIVLLPHMMT